MVVVVGAGVWGGGMGGGGVFEDGGSVTWFADGVGRGGCGLGRCL